MAPVSTTSLRFFGSRAEGICLLLFTTTAWGLAWPQSKFLLSMLPPFSMRASCVLGGSLFAFTIALINRERLLPPRDQWTRLWLLGTLNYGLYYALTAQSLAWLTGSEAVMLGCTMPIWASILAWPILGERPTGVRIAAILLGCGGVAILLGIGSLDTTWEKLPGIATGLLAAWVFSAGTILTKKYPLQMTTATSVAWQGFIGAIPVMLLALQERPVWTDVTYAGFGALLFISAVALSLAYFSWFRALRLIPASTAAIAVLITPAVGVAGSMLMLGEALALRQMAALVLILSAVALAVMYSNNDK